MTRRDIWARMKPEQRRNWRLDPRTGRIERANPRAGNKGVAMRDKPENGRRPHIVDVDLAEDPDLAGDTGGSWALSFDDADDAITYADDKSGEPG